MDVLKTLIVVVLGLSIAKKLAKGILKIIIILGLLAYLFIKVIA